MMGEPRPGDIIDDRFSVLERLGGGGMSSVYKAMDMVSGLPVALKFPLPRFESDPAGYSRFLREIEIARGLSHPGVLKVLTVEHPSRPYLAMEFLDGRTLWDRLDEGPLSLDESRTIAATLCDALAYLHREGVVHRDLKPANVMLLPDGSLRIMDFGVALSESARRMTYSGFTSRFGTPQYMAPEQVKGQRGDARTDVYCLGAVLYEMTTGRQIFDEQLDLAVVVNARVAGDPIAPRTHNPEIPPELEEIILRALARDPAERYQSAAEMKTDLLAPERVRVTGRVDRLVRPSVLAPLWKYVGIAAGALGAAVLLFFVFLRFFER